MKTEFIRDEKGDIIKAITHREMTVSEIMNSPEFSQRLKDGLQEELKKRSPQLVIS